MEAMGRALGDGTPRKHEFNVTKAMTTKENDIQLSEAAAENSAHCESRLCGPGD